MESGIAHWAVDPDLDANEQEMMSKFHGYNREMRHYSTKEKRVIRDPAFVSKVNNTFKNSPVPFSIYFWQSRNPNYDPTSFQGLVDQAWLEKHLGESAARAILAQTSPDVVTVVLTNNLSDENKVGLGSPWIIAHRIVHAMVGDSSTDEAHRIIDLMESFLRRVLSVGYHCRWPEKDGPYGDVFHRDYLEAYGTLMGHTIGTMKSARSGRITSVYEWWYETVTQFIVTGKITFKPLPDHFDDGLDLTHHPRMRQIALKMWANLPGRLEGAITELLDAGRGKVFVV